MDDGRRRAGRWRSIPLVLDLVFTRADAVDAGHQPREIDARVRSGDWTALRRGIYIETARLPAEPAARHAVEVLAASRATRQEVVGSHESAAVVHELTTFARYDGPPVLSRCREVGVARPDPCNPGPLVSHVPPQHRDVVHGAPVTTLPRTAVDLARKGPPLSAVVALDAALRRGASREELDEALRVARGWPGSRKAAQMIAFADARAESALESVGRWRMHQLQLPRPELQVNLFDAEGFIGRVDFLFEELRVVGEADGMAKYRRSADDAEGDEADDALGLEKLREDRMRDSGYGVFRFTWDVAVRRPAVLEARALRAFARAGRRAA